MVDEVCETQKKKTKLNYINARHYHVQQEQKKSNNNKNVSKITTSASSFVSSGYANATNDILHLIFSLFSCIRNKCIFNFFFFSLFFVAAVVITFFVCWAPFHAQRLMYLYARDWDYYNAVNTWLFSVAGWLYYVSW